MSHTVWQSRIIEQEKQLSNHDLYERVMELSGGNSYDGSYLDREWWVYQYLLGRLEERLEEWFNDGN